MFRVFIFFTVGIILFDYIAGFTRDEKYSGSIINEISQVVFMDERTNDSLTYKTNFARQLPETFLNYWLYEP